MEPASVTFGHRPQLDHDELQRLFEASWGQRKCDFRQVLARSFTWVAAFAGDELVGFVNVAWDGGVHFFLLDTTVHPDWRRRGIGRRLVEEAARDCHDAGEWLHVDADEALMDGLYSKQGFQATAAGTLQLGG